MAREHYQASEKVVQKMTRDGLMEENAVTKEISSAPGAEKRQQYRFYDAASKDQLSEGAITTAICPPSILMLNEVSPSLILLLLEKDDPAVRSCPLSS